MLIWRILHLSIQILAQPDSRYFEPPPSPTELRIVERIFRLSIKYGSTYFRRRAVSHLNSTFPMTLEGWHNTRTIPVLDLDDLSTAIRIAKEFKLDWLLPSIFYCICSHPIEITHDLFSIQYEDLKVPYFSGRQKLLKMQANVGLHIQYIITRQCQSEQCTSTVYTVADTLCSFGVAALLDFFVDNQEGLCQSCNSVLKAEGDIACQNMWRELPAVFRLPGWEDLKQKEKHTY